MALPQLPLQRHHADDSSHTQQPAQLRPPRRLSPPVRPPAPPPIERLRPMRPPPPETQPPLQLQPTLLVGIPSPSTAQKRKYEPPAVTDRDYSASGPEARYPQWHTQPAPLPFYPRLGRTEVAPQQVVSSTGSLLYDQRPRANMLLSEGNTTQLRTMLHNLGSRTRATEANSIDILPRQTRRGAFVRRQLQRKAEMEQLAAERLQRDMGDGASDEERYWKGGVQNVAEKYDISGVQGLAQIEWNLKFSREMVWRWIERVPDDVESLERDLVLEEYEWE